MSRIGPRQPLPIDLRPRLSIEDLLWVANTRHGPGGHWFARVTDDLGDHDHLAEPGEAKDYLVRHRVPLPKEDPSPKDLRQLDEVREMVRGLVNPTSPAWTTAVRAILESSRFSAGTDGTIQADATDWDAFIRDLMLPLLQLIDVRERLRLCGNEHCRLVFLDLSRNQSRRWCDTAGCGNRERVRRYRDSHPMSSD